jgi:hypothetical protein
MLPSGSTKNAIEGLANIFGGHIGAASITPPILQKCSIYSSQSLNKVGYAILTFLGRTFFKTSKSFSMIDSVISTFFFRSSIMVLTVSTFSEA